MTTRFVRFNIYLSATLALMATGGCLAHKGKDKDKDATTITLHLETDPDGLSDIGPESINRSDPIIVSVNKAPFLDGGDLDEAAVVDEPGGLYSIRLKFNWQGAATLDGVTSANPGRRIAIYCAFGDARWLAAPLIRQRISNGLLTFTPDASHEEAERIVRGLNNVAKGLKKADKNDEQF
jgi:preprotein translocase subunit SecD